MVMVFARQKLERFLQQVLFALKMKVDEAKR